MHSLTWNLELSCLTDILTYTLKSLTDLLLSATSSNLSDMSKMSLISDRERFARTLSTEVSPLNVEEEDLIKHRDSLVHWMQPH